MHFYGINKIRSKIGLQVEMRRDVWQKRQKSKVMNHEKSHFQNEYFSLLAMNFVSGTISSALKVIESAAGANSLLRYHMEVFILSTFSQLFWRYT